jgi:tripartite-type tricarboxylate transporter receptor subunit TctC
MSIFPSPFSRRHLLQGSAAMAAASILPVDAQASFPRGPVRFIVPLTAGGAADVATRALAPQLEKMWGQPVIIDNKPGGMFVIGLQSLIQAPADGHTLMYLFNSISTVQVVHKKFDLATQIIPVTQSTVAPMILMVGGNSPFKTVRDLVAYGRANPGKLSYATLGPGSIEHLKAAQFEQVAGFKANAVPYKSGPEMAKDVVSGEADFCMIISTFGPLYAPSGRARVLAVLDNQRMKELPDAPTMAEAGVALPPLAYWGGYAVRSGTPPDLVRRLQQDIAKVAASDEVTEKLSKMSFRPVVSKDPTDFRRVIESDMGWMTDVAKSLNLKPE